MPQDEQTRASLPSTRGTSTPLPGAWQAAGVAALAALIFGYWAQLGTATQAAGTASISQMAEVAPQDMGAALDTVGITPQQTAQILEKEACSRHLAWVTIMRSPGAPPGRIRLQSGDYFSPVFELTDAPVRVALPYPAPYPSGQGTITVMGATADAIVALTPPWHVAAQTGLNARQVRWSPAAGCPAPGK